LEVVIFRTFSLSIPRWIEALTEVPRGLWSSGTPQVGTSTVGPILATRRSGFYLLIIRSGDYNEGAQLADLGNWPHYLAAAWNCGVTPLLVGQWISQDATRAQEGAIVGAQALLLALVAASIVRRRATWRVWAVYLVWWAANVGLIGYAQLYQFGPSIGLDLRYNAEFAFLLPLTLLLAFRGPGDGQRIPFRPRGALVAVAAGGVAVAVTLSVFSSYVRVERAWGAEKSRALTANVRASLASLRSRGVEPVLMDDDVPFEVVTGIPAPFNRLSSVLPLVDERIRMMDGPPNAALAVAQPDGVIRVARRVRVAHGSVGSLHGRSAS
jgi:hypothetical protein